MSIFEKATRSKLRFDSPQGLLDVEYLWDLPLTSKAGRANLDDIARSLNKKLKSGDDVSFVDPARKSDEGIQLAFDIVKHIIDVRLEENRKALEDKDRAEKKQRLLQIIAEKKDEHLKGKSLEELQKELETM